MDSLNKLLMTALGLSLFCANAYGVDSKFDTSYKCISEFSGGINHSENGHVATKFRERDEFRLTHINNLKASTLKKWPGIANLHEVEENTWSYAENRAHFFRSTSQPEELSVLFTPRCVSHGEEENGSFKATQIHCSDSNKIFDFRPPTGRFIYTYLGSYDPTGGDEAKKYYGDSSVFEYGTCTPYYD